MQRADGQPWFLAALELLDLRRQDRVLVLDATPSQVRVVAAVVGSRGAVTVVEPERAPAEAIAAMDLPNVEVLAHRTSGTERFGAFDALLVAPLCAPPWPEAAFAELPRHNLRPGGRLVLDLPGPEMAPDLAAVWLERGLAPERLAPLRGIADDRLAALLRDAGLRRVQALLGSHLLAAESPFDHVDALTAALQTTDAERRDLGDALVRRLGTTGRAELLVHRTRVQALR
jgi:SAM-dependent methyltransferase